MIGSTRKAGSYLPPSELILRDDGSVYHLGLRSDDIARKVIIVGDPDRVERISSRFDRVDKKVSNREFVAHTGEFSGRPMTVISSGIGVDNIDIVLNELDAAINVDPETRKVRDSPRHLEIVRIGTSGSLQEDLPIGSIVVSAFAYGWDAVPFYYDLRMSEQESYLAAAIERELRPMNFVGKPYAAQASPKLLESVGKGFPQGITATSNGFYGPQDRTLRLMGMGNFSDRLRKFSHSGLRITNFEMETAGIYALSSAMGHHALSVCVILADRTAKEFHKAPSESIEKLIDVVLERF